MVNLRSASAALLVGLFTFAVLPVASFGEEKDKQPQERRPELTPQLAPQIAVPNAIACFRANQALRCTPCEAGWHCSGTGDGSCQPPSDTSCNK